MEQSTPIQHLNSRDEKQMVENMSYNDILTQIQPSAQQPTIPPTNPQMNPPLKQTPLHPSMSTPIHTPVVPTQTHYEEYRDPIQHANPNSRYLNDQTHMVYNQPPSSLKKHSTPIKTTDFHNEMIVLLVVYIIVHTEQFQSFIRSKLPSMFNPETLQINIFGTLMNGIMLIILWNFFKKIAIKYMNEFN